MTVQLAPMLPSEFSAHASKVRWDNATAQPHFTGERCFAFFENGKVKITNTNNVEIKSVPHINASLQYALVRRPETILDGFLVSDDVDVVTLKKHLKKLNNDNSKFKFIICDQILDQPFMLRFKPLEYFAQDLVSCAETVKIKNREDLNYYQSRCFVYGYSHICLRHLADGYKSGNVLCLLKVNTAKTKDFYIADFKPGTGDFAGLGVIVCETKDSEEFEVACPRKLIELENLIKLFSKKPPNKVTVAYFDLTLGEDSVPKFPVAVGFK